MINRDREFMRCVYGGLTARLRAMPDEEWAAWQSHRNAVVRRAEQERAARDAQLRANIRAGEAYIASRERELRMAAEDSVRRASR